MSRWAARPAVVIAAVALAGLAVGCESSGSTDAEPTTTTTTAARCGDHQQDCSSAQVIAAAERYYTLAGATSTESKCLAPITGQGKHAVNQAFEAPTAAQTEAAVKCVGSSARLREIANGMAKYAASVAPSAEGS